MHTRIAPNALFLLLLLLAAAGFAQESHIGKLTGHANSGKDLYRRYCIYCHGKFGDGTGENALYLDPKPRDFTKATFKCRSTPSGTLPVDRDLFDSITRGFHASNMPSWKPLTTQNRADLVAYIKTFSPSFKEEKPGTPIVIPSEPALTPQSVQRGAELFRSMNCWSCHGKDGRGNGPSALALTDSKGYPIHPYDLTSGTRSKCGSTDQALFKDLMTGLDGTPMPSFSTALSTDQVWDVVHYIHELQRGKGPLVDRAKSDTEPE